ncbi:unnamed protein product [Candida verbasci]|uniref:Zn(2)-C6 fungal-type domain-containing protein n=1 Tax=Candida verbasci TaxID=1227364 RepID=A0A9W4TZ01_9ASCO|nr:unnamed protein product [Candida verbasci]
MDSKEQPPAGKKRNRIPASCSVCRKRKSKCDRVRPVCGSCIKKSIAHLCFYKESKQQQQQQQQQQPVYDYIPHHLPPPPSHPHTPYDFIQSPQYQSPQYQSPQYSSPQNYRMPPLTYRSYSIPLPQPPTAPQPPQPPPIKLKSIDFSPRDPISSPSSYSLKTPSDFASNSLVAIPLGSNSSLQVNPEDRMDVFTNASFSLFLEGPYWQQQGTLSYIGSTKSDPFITILRNFVVHLFKAGEMTKFIKSDTTRKRKNSSGSVYSNKKPRTSSGTSPLSPLNFTPTFTPDKVEEIINSPNSKKERKIPTSFPSKYAPDYYQLVGKIVLDLLPNKINTFQLFCRFFKYVSPFVPIIDEHSLIVEVNGLFKNFPSFKKEYFDELIIKNDNDLKVVGILLLILRLGYLTLIHNDSAHNNYSDDEISIIEDVHTISSQDYLKIVDLCIRDTIVSKSTFKMVQLLTLLYHYKSIAPDDSNGVSGADSQILLGTTIKHALSIGLNRDPTQYTEIISNNPTLIKSWRNLWWYLSIMDAMTCLHNCTSLNINLQISDVRIPDSDFNILQHLNEITQCYRRIVNKITNVNLKPKVIEILKETNHLEKIFFDFFGKDFFKDEIMKPASEYDLLKVYKYCIFIQLRTNLSGMYYMIAIHYENEYNESQTPSMNAGIELFKIYIKSVVQLVYIISYVLDNSVEIFGKNFDYYLTSINERYMIKTHSFLQSFFVRLLHQKKDLSFKVFKEPSSIPRLEVIDNLFTMILVEAELFVGNFRKLSRTYLNSYRIYIITFIVLRQCVENPDVFFEKAISDQSFFHQGTNMIEFFTVAELQHLVKLCGEFRLAKQEQTKLKNERRQQTNIFDDNSLFSNNYLSFFDDENIFNNLHNLGDEIIDPVKSNDDLMRIFNIFGDFDNDLNV